jgi:hypothetical protein
MTKIVHVIPYSSLLRARTYGQMKHLSMCFDRVATADDQYCRRVPLLPNDC